VIFRKYFNLFSALLFASTSIIIANDNSKANGATCHGLGKAKTTFLPGSITSAELRNTTEWNFSCGTGALLAPVSLTNHYVYSNGAIDLTSSYWSSSNTNLALPDYLFGKMAAAFDACDSFLCSSGFYSFTLHNYVYTTNYDFGNSIRSCWISGETSYMPGYKLRCGT
jgi:hypothetical protein